MTADHATRSVPPDCCHEPAPPLLIAGIQQFNRGEYYEQHETLEALWNEEPRPVRRLYQGVLQVGVALYHLRRLNYHGVVTMLTRARHHLEEFAPWCQGVDVDALLADVAATLVSVESLGPARLHEFDWARAPRVRLTE